MRAISRRGFLGGGLAAILAGCSTGGGDDPDVVGPSVTNETVLSNNYEGTTNVSVDVDVDDPAGVSDVRLLYRVSGSTDSWTEAAQLTLNTGSTYSGSFTMPASDTYDFVIVATDSKNNVSTTLEQVVDSWANEANAETEILTKLAEFKTNGDITDYFGPDYTINLLSGDIIVDAAVLDGNFKAISYKGESDTVANITADTAAFNAWFVPVTDIREMIKSRLPTEMDNAKTNSWVDNVYVERMPAEYREGLKTAGKAVLASVPVALGIGLYALFAGNDKARELGRKVGSFFRSAAPVLAPVAVGGAIALVASTASAEDIEERIENCKKIKTIYNKCGVARIEETTEDKGEYKTNIYKLNWHTAEQELVGVEEGIIQNNQNVRLKTQYFNIDQDGIRYDVTADHEKKTVELNKTS